MWSDPLPTMWNDEKVWFVWLEGSGPTAAQVH